MTFLKPLFVVFLFSVLTSCSKKGEDFKLLQPVSQLPNKIKSEEFDFKEEILYIPVTKNTVTWGHLPNLNSKPTQTKPNQTRPKPNRNRTQT